jgi:hypothetical protein
MKNSEDSLRSTPALTVQPSYLGMSMFWNLVNVGLTAAGQKPLGPVGSLELVVAMAVAAILLVVSVRRLIWLYAGLSLLLALGAINRIYGTFTGAPNNWSSTFFRVFGATINVVGVVGAVLACQLVIRSRHS